MRSELKVKADLKEAFKSALGTRLESPETVHLLAWYLNGLAESYGLSDHGNVNEYASERVELPQQAMESLAGVLGSDEPDDDSLRTLLYNSATAVSGDAGARRKLNQNDPPSETAVLALVQAYWNLSPDSELRPLLPLPLEASQGAAPNGPLVSDALALKLTARTEAGVSCDGYQVSKAAYRRQGARLAVLLASRMISEVGKESLGVPEGLILDFTNDGSTLSVEWQEREETSSNAAPASVGTGPEGAVAATEEPLPSGGRPSGETERTPTLVTTGPGGVFVDHGYEPPLTVPVRRAYEADLEQAWQGGRGAAWGPEDSPDI